MSVYDRIPKSAGQAHVMLGERRFVALDSVTRLVRDGYGQVVMLYRGEPLVYWAVDGNMRVKPPRYGYMPRTVLKRIAAALPDEWSVDMRPRRGARFLYRGVYPTDFTDTTFRVDGGVQWYNSSDTRNVMTRAQMDREVSNIEGFSPLSSRRRSRASVAVRVPVSEAQDFWSTRRRGVEMARVVRQQDAARARSERAAERAERVLSGYATGTNGDLAPFILSTTTLEARCVHCGLRYGEHYGQACPDGSGGLFAATRTDEEQEAYEQNLAELVERLARPGVLSTFTSPTERD